MTARVLSLLDDRPPRERLLLAGALGLALLWAVVALVWQPLAARRMALEAEVRHLDQLLAGAAQLPPSRALSPVALDDRPLAVIATTTAGDMGLMIRRLQPQGQGVQVDMDDAPFDIVLMWIAALERDHALRLAELTLTRRSSPGTVAATLTLERP